MGYSSPPDLLVLHAVRLLGMADDAAVARRFGLDPAVAEELLLDFQASGWIQRVSFADISGWALTDAGRAEDVRRLAAELDQTGARLTVATAYADFDLLNKSFLEVIMNWQIRPTRDDSMARNDHSDQGVGREGTRPQASSRVYEPAQRPRSFRRVRRPILRCARSR